jgi:hypothetical protein
MESGFAAFRVNSDSFGLMKQNDRTGIDSRSATA